MLKAHRSKRRAETLLDESFAMKLNLQTLNNKALFSLTEISCFKLNPKLKSVNKVRSFDLSSCENHANRNYLTKAMQGERLNKMLSKH